MADKTPRVINPANMDHRHTEMLKLAEFIGAESIEYKDLGMGENYIIIKDGKRKVLKIRGNKFDGGFFYALDDTEEDDLPRRVILNKII